MFALRFYTTPFSKTLLHLRQMVEGLVVAGPDSGFAHSGVLREYGGTMTAVAARASLSYGNVRILFCQARRIKPYVSECGLFPLEVVKNPRVSNSLISRFCGPSMMIARKV
jgi:hypothetical protein